MKKLTKEQVFEQLVDNASAELEGLGEQTTMRYYLHVKEDGTIVNNYRNADATFVEDIPYWCYADTLEEFYDIEDSFYDTYESMAWKPFAETVEDLTNDANEWLEEIEQEKEQEDM